MYTAFRVGKSFEPIMRCRYLPYLEDMKSGLRAPPADRSEVGQGSALGESVSSSLFRYQSLLTFSPAVHADPYSVAQRTSL